MLDDKSHDKARQMVGGRSIFHRRYVLLMRKQNQIRNLNATNIIRFWDTLLVGAAQPLPAVSIEAAVYRPEQRRSR